MVTGVMISFTKLETILLNVPPINNVTARSIMLPLVSNFLKSLQKVLLFFAQVFDNFFIFIF